MRLSRRCIPWTPPRRPVRESRICLVSSAAVRMAGDSPFNPEGDTSFRKIEGTARASDLAYDDTHYDHACVDQDLNCVFPLDRLHELGEAGEIRGVTDHHYAFGFTMKLRQIRDETFPEIADAVDRHRPDIVLLTGG